MAQAPRPNKQCMKIAYTILNTPKDKRQDNQVVPSPKKIREWFRDSSMSQ